MAMWIREPAVAGTFYPADGNKLYEEVSRYLNNAPAAAIKGEITALIAPHAGYMYSAPVAAAGYSLLKGAAPDSIVILAPSHRAGFQGASVFSRGVYKTPLGPVKLMDSFAAEILACEYFGFVKAAHQFEHSLEVQLPFIQVQLPDIPVLPVVVGTTDYEICVSIGRTLGNLIASSGDKTLIIISTDLSHFHSYDEAVKIDRNFIELLKKFDAALMSRSLESGEAEACGHGPLIAGITASKIIGAVKTEIIEYKNSGDTAGSRGSVVGYLSAAFTE